MNKAVSVASLASSTAIAAPQDRPDPIFAVIERLRKVELAVDETEAPDQALIRKLCKAQSKFARTIPTTPAGLAAMASYLHEAQTRLGGAGPYFDLTSDAEAFAATLNTAVNQMLGFRTSRAKPGLGGSGDPILNIIDRYRALSKKHDESCEHEPERRSPTHSAWDKACESACTAAARELEKLISTVPITTLGAAALVRCYLDRCDNDLDEEIATLLESLHSFLQATGPARMQKGIPAAKNPDAKLTTATNEMIAATAELIRFHDAHKENEPDVDTRSDYRRADARRDKALAILATTPAQSWSGILAKASVLQERSLIEDWTRHGKIATSLADDLLRLSV
jgi:hypothetical protein